MEPDNPLRDPRAARALQVGEEVVEVAFDPDGEVWFVRASSVPGLAGEAETLPALESALPGLIRAAKLP